MTPEQRNNMAVFKVYANVECGLCVKEQYDAIKNKTLVVPETAELEARIIREGEIENSFTMIAKVTCSVHGGDAIFVETAQERIKA